MALHPRHVVSARPLRGQRRLVYGTYPHASLAVGDVTVSRQETTLRCAVKRRGTAWRFIPVVESLHDLCEVGGVLYMGHIHMPRSRGFLI